MSAPHPLWTNDRWRRRPQRITIRPVERVEEMANELALLVAQEHRRANEERARREAADATAVRLAAVLVHAFAELESEREARRRAEAEVRDLTTLVLNQRRPQRFSHHARGRAAAL
jgi:hypothetical protein